MPRVKSSRKRTAESLPELPATVQSELPSGADERLTMFDATGDSRIRVMRRDDKTMKLVMHGYLPPESSEGDVAAMFGGGHYKCQLIVKDSQGASVIGGGREFDVPGPYKPPTGDLPGLGTSGAKAPLASTVSSGTVGMPARSDSMEILNSAMIGTVVDLLKASKEASSRPADNSMALILEGMREDRALMLKMIERLSQPQGGTRAEVLAELEMMKRIVVPSQDSGREKLSELVGALKELREASEELAPSGRDDPTDPLAFVPKILEVIGEEQQLRKANRTTQPGRPAPAPAAITRGQPMPEPESPVPSLPLIQQILNHEGPRLVQQANMGTDPGKVAELAVTFMPPNVRGAISEFFNGPTDEVVAALRRLVPPLNEYPKWTEEFVVAAQYELFGEPPEEEVMVVSPDAPVQ